MMNTANTVSATNSSRKEIPSFLAKAPVEATMSDSMVLICDAYAKMSSALQCFSEAYAIYCKREHLDNDLAETLSFFMDEYHHQ